jgi:hypothetical protein
VPFVLTQIALRHSSLPTQPKITSRSRGTRFNFTASLLFCQIRNALFGFDFLALCLFASTLMGGILGGFARSDAFLSASAFHSNKAESEALANPYI